MPPDRKRFHSTKTITLKGRVASAHATIPTSTNQRLILHRKRRRQVARRRPWGQFTPLRLESEKWGFGIVTPFEISRHWRMLGSTATATRLLAKRGGCMRFGGQYCDGAHKETNAKPVACFFSWPRARCSTNDSHRGAVNCRQPRLLRTRIGRPVCWCPAL